MFSGKTTELIKRIHAYPPGTNFVAFKPEIDDRYSPTNIVSHDGEEIEAQAVPNAHAIMELAGQAAVVAIDEIHFFDDTLIDVCKQLAARGMVVVCCGLDRDMWGDPFLLIEKLGRIARSSILSCPCKVCGRPANRTHRTIPLLDANLVGGPESFEPRCEECFEPPSQPKPKDARGAARKPAT